jgi:FAD/FMN-containing dehydrogenase
MPRTAPRRWWPSSRASAAAGEAVAALTASGLQLSLCEIMDRRTVLAVDDWMRMGLDRDAAALLLVQSDAPAPQRAADVERAAELCDRAGASYTAFTADPDEAEALLQARRLAGPALERLGEPIWDDVGVPRSRIPALLARIEQVADRHGADVYTFGHAGDGNMHPVLLVPHGDDDARAVPWRRSTASWRPPSTSAGRSPGSTGSEPSRRTCSRARWGRTTSPCSARSSGRSTHTTCSTPAGGCAPLPARPLSDAMVS